MNVNLKQLEDLTSKLIQKDRELKRSEERYKRIVEDQTELIFRCLPEGTITFANNSFHNYFDIPRDDLIGINFTKYIVDEDKEDFKELVNIFNETYPISHLRIKVNPGGREKWSEWTIRCFFDENQLPLSYQCVGRDVTDQVKMEEILYKRCSLLHTISENIAATFWVKDLEDRYVFASEKLANELFNTSSDYIIGYTDSELEANLGDKLLCHNISSCSIISDKLVRIQNKTLRFYEIYVTNNIERWFDVKKSPLKSMGGKLIGTVGVAYEITEEQEDIKRGLPKRILKDDVTQLIENKLYQLKKL